MTKESTKFKEFLKKVLKKLIGNVFLLFIFLLVLDLIIGSLIFWHYGFSVRGRDIQVPPPLTLNQKLLNDFEDDYIIREKDYSNVLYKEYQNIFKSHF